MSMIYTDRNLTKAKGRPGAGRPVATAWEVAMRRSYLGGVHPASYKESTRRKPIVPLEEAPKQVVIPLTMCSGGGAVRLSGPGTR